MAFYTGKEVKVWVCTECTDAPKAALAVITGDATDKNKMAIDDMTASTSTYRAVEMFAAPYDGAGVSGLNVTDLTGIDVSIGAVDEDISYFQTANVGKIEVKKETSLTLTRKMSDKAFLVAYQGKVAVADAEDGVGNHTSRWGLKNATNIASGATDPKNTTTTDGSISYGFRLYVLLKASGQVFIIPNCTLMSHAVTTSNDAANEETVEFMSTVKPIITQSATYTSTATSATNI